MNQLDILKFMAGHTAQSPIAFDNLVKKSGIDAVVLLGDLQRLFNSQPTPINCAQITKGGKTYMVYWPTGAIAVRIGPQSIVINAAKAEAAGYRGAAAVQPKSNQKEITMTTHSQPRKPKHNPIREMLLQLIHDVPHQTRRTLREQVLARYPLVEIKRFDKALWDMAHRKEVMQQGKADEATYRLPYIDAQAVATPTKTNAVAECAAIVKPTPQHLADPVKAIVERGAEQMDLMLSESDHLHIVLGEEHFCLNPIQAKRLQGFLGRVIISAGAQ